MKLRHRLSISALTLLFVFSMSFAMAGREREYTPYVVIGIAGMALAAILATWLLIRIATANGKSN